MEVVAAPERNWKQPSPWLVRKEKRRVRKAQFRVCGWNRCFGGPAWQIQTTA